MSRTLIPAVLASTILAACGAAETAKTPSIAEAGATPLPAPKTYRSADKNLTFPTPAGAFYCAKPEGWVGSDHGTVVFLTAPETCGGGDAYASSERGALTAPNVQVYYGYDVLEPEEKPAPAPCEEIGRAAFLGGERPLCIRRREGGVVEVRVEAPYMAEGAEEDIKAEAAFTLVTDAARLDADLATFRTLLARTSTCNRTDVADGSTHPNDRPACAADAVWF